MMYMVKSLWFKFFSALAVCLLAAIISNYLTPQKSDAYSRLPAQADDPGAKSVNSEPTAQTLWSFFFHPGGADANTKNLSFTPSETQIKSVTPTFHLPAQTVTVTGSATTGNSIVGYSDGVMFYFPTDEGEVATATQAWQVIYYTDLPSQTLAPTLTPKNTFTPKPTSTSRNTKTPTIPFTATTTPTQTPTPTPSPTLTITPTITETPLPTQQMSPTATLPTIEVSPTPSPSETSLVYDGSFAYVDQPDREDPFDVVLYGLANQTSQILAPFEDVKLCSWNQDGSDLLIRSKKTGADGFDLIALNVSGEQKVLTSALAGSSECGDWLTNSQVIFPYSDETGLSSIIEYDMETGLITPIYQDENQKSELDLSSDIQWAVFVSTAGETREIALLELANGQVMFLTNNDVDEESPHFSPDGQTVFFSRFVDGNWKIVSYDLASASETEFGNGRWPDLSKDGKALLFSAEVNGVNKVFLGLPGQSRPIQLVSNGDAQTYPLWRP